MLQDLEYWRCIWFTKAVGIQILNLSLVGEVDFLSCVIHNRLKQIHQYALQYSLIVSFQMYVMCFMNAQFLCSKWNTVHNTHKKASYELRAPNNKIPAMVYDDTPINAQFWVYTAILHWNTTNSYMVWSLWDNHQGVCTSNDPALDVKDHFCFTTFIRLWLGLIWLSGQLFAS